MARTAAFLLLILVFAPPILAGDEDEKQPPAEPADIDAEPGEERPADANAEAEAEPADPLSKRPPVNEEERKKALKGEVEGYWNNMVRYQNAGGENKIGLISDLAADFIYKGGKLPFRVRLNGRMVAQSGSNPGDLLYNTWDTFSNNLNGRLYELYVQSESKGAVNGRLGRMFMEEGAWLQFDGGRIDFESKSVPGLSAYVIGGVPAYFHNRSRSGN